MGDNEGSGEEGKGERFFKKIWILFLCSSTAPSGQILSGKAPKQDLCVPKSHELRQLHFNFSRCDLDKKNKKIKDRDTQMEKKRGQSSYT